MNNEINNTNEISYETILEIVKNYFSSEDYVWLVCDEAKEGWVRATVDEIAEELEIWVGDKEADLDDLKKKLATYRELNLDGLYSRVDRDSFSEKNVKNDSVMYINENFWMVAGEDYVRENPLEDYKFYDEEYVQAAKDVIAEDKEDLYRYKIQDCISWMLIGEDTKLTVDEDIVLEETVQYFLSEDLEDLDRYNFPTLDVYKYLEKYIVE